MANNNGNNYVLNVELRDIRTGGSLHLQIDLTNVESFLKELDDDIFKWKNEDSSYIFRYVNKDNSLAHLTIGGEFATVPINPAMIEEYSNGNSNINDKRNTNNYIPLSVHLLIEGEFSKVPIEQVLSTLEKYNKNNEGKMDKDNNYTEDVVGGILSAIENNGDTSAGAKKCHKTLKELLDEGAKEFLKSIRGY